MIHDVSSEPLQVVSADPLETAHALLRLRRSRPGMDDKVYSYAGDLDGRVLSVTLTLGDLEALCDLAETASPAEVRDAVRDDLDDSVQTGETVTRDDDGDPVCVMTQGGGGQCGRKAKAALAGRVFVCGIHRRGAEQRGEDVYPL